MTALRNRLERWLTFGRGRPLAMALLGVLIALNVLSESDAALRREAPTLGQSLARLVTLPFHVARQAGFDLYQAVFPRVPQSHPVTIVEIDEASLKQQGQWPWPRDRLARLINAVGAQGALAIGLDVYMPEPDQTSPPSLAQALEATHPEVARALRRLPGHDELLAQALQGAPTVLGAAGFDFETLTTSAGLRTRGIQISGGEPTRLRAYPWVLASLPQLQAAAAGQAMLSVDADDNIVRRVPLVMAVNGQVVPGLALEMLRVATAAPAIEVLTQAGDVDRVGVADLSLAVQPEGDVWLHFAPAVAGLGRYVSANAVLAGEADPELFANKLVLVGLTGYGLADRRLTALRENVPGIEIQAQLLESIFDGRVLLRPWWVTSAETALLALFGVVFVYWLRRPSAWVLGAFLGVFALAGWGLFLSHGLLINAAAPALILPVVFGSMLLSSGIEIRQRNAVLAAERQRLKEEALVVAGELSAARRIQLGSLPKPEQVLQGQSAFDLAAFMEPAKEVGGDLYDFFMIDATRLGFVVGDVSGKGLPASLFMAITKTLAQTLARHVEADPGRAAELANALLARENPESLFVTLLMGVLDTATGELALVNAGHDAPWRRSADGTLTHLACPPDAGGPPLCMLDDFPYGTQRVQLTPGDTVFIVTDGVTEAMNPDGAIYGTQRLESVLSGTDAPSAEAWIATIRDAVRAHVAGAEPSDDMTLLVLRWTPASA